MDTLRRYWGRGKGEGHTDAEIWLLTAALIKLLAY